jgi:glycosidase
MAFGDFEMLLPSDSQVYAFTRTLGDEGLLVVANWSNEAIERTLEIAREDMVSVIHNYEDAPAFDSALSLRPWEVVVYRW